MKTSNFAAHFLFQGFGLLLKPGLKRYVLMPLLINILAFTGFWLISWHFFNELLLWLDTILPIWLQWLGWLLWPVFVAGTLLFTIFTFTWVANLIASPFNGLLSEQVQGLLLGEKPEGYSFIQILPQAIKRQLALLTYFLPRLLFFGMLFFIPIVQIAAPFLWLAFNAWMMCLQYADFPTDNNKISFLEMRLALSQKRLTSYSFGATVLFLSGIPIINLFVMPAAVAGATALWIKEFSE